MAVTPKLIQKAVTTHGTRAQITSDTSILAQSVIIEPFGTNTGFIYVGSVAVTSTIYMSRLPAANAGTNYNQFKLQAIEGGRIGATGIQLSNLYIDSSVDGDKVNVIYLEHEG